MTATDELRQLLDERGVEWDYGITGSTTTRFSVNGIDFTLTPMRDGLVCSTILTHEQAVEATLGREPWSNPTWERWHKSLRHDEIKSIGDAVEQLMYEVIEFGGDMGPNGNTYNGIDEGDVLTSGFINEWIARFESTLGRDRYSYEQYREITNAVGDAMEYAHDKAIEHPDKADPLWDLDEYVSRILKVAFEGETTPGWGTCHKVRAHKEIEDEMHCSECGRFLGFAGDIGAPPYNYCPSCGRKVVDE